MYRSSPFARAMVVAALLVAAAPAALLRSHPVQARATNAACPAAGTYEIGLRALPMAPAPGRSAAPGATGPIASPLWLLRGQLRIATYAGCGGATQGTFAAHRVWMGPPVQRGAGSSGPQTGTALPCAMPCVPAAGLAAATGSFTSDPLHPRTPLYVRVSATITSTRPGPVMGRPCSTRSGCPPSTVITSTVTFDNVTGYLQVSTGGDPQTAILSFLPPPVGVTATAPDPVSLYGWRGSGVGATPVPAPR